MSARGRRTRPISAACLSSDYDGRGCRRGGDRTLWVVAVFVFGLTFARARPGLRHFLAGACVAAGLGAITADGIETGHVLLLCASVIYGWYLAKLPHVENYSGKAAAVANASAGALFVLIAFIDGNRWAVTGL